MSAIVESSEDAIIGTALDGTVTSWNDGARRLFGYAAEEVLGRHLMLLLPPGQQAALDALLAEAGRGGSRGVRETEGVRKDGATIDVSVTFSPVFDGGKRVVGVSAIARDITPLVVARDEITAREERIRLLLDSAAEAIYGVDLNGECTFCNAACARLLGYESPADADRAEHACPRAPHARRRHAVSPRAVADPRGDAQPRAGARGRRGAVARRRDVVPGGVLEPSDPARRRRHRRRRHVPRHHRAAAGRGGDPGGGPPPRAVPGDALARAAQSAGRHPGCDAAARSGRMGQHALPGGRPRRRAAGAST